MLEMVEWQCLFY